MLKARFTLLLAALASWGFPASAQTRGDIIHGAILPADTRFGRMLLWSYVGYISFSRISGDTQEHISLKLEHPASGTPAAGSLESIITCDVNYQDPEGSYTLTGPGLIEISLGLDPDEDDTTNKPGTMYSIRAACPSAKTGLRAAWSNSFDTYKQPGGAYRAVPMDETLVLRGVPAELTGGYRITVDEENTSMAWRFCRGTTAICEVPTLPPARPPER